MIEQSVAFMIQMIGESMIEMVAFGFGIINIVLLIRRNIFNYVFGMVMVSLYGVIFYDARLYSDAILQVFFFVMQIYGIYSWMGGKDNQGEIIVERLSRSQTISLTLFSMTAILLWGYLMLSYTQADYPYWDGAIAVLSIIAQFLLARRYLENWVLWIIIDILAVMLFATKGLYATAALYGIYIILATVGLQRWFVAHMIQKNNAEPDSELEIGHNYTRF